MTSLTMENETQSVDYDDEFDYGKMKLKVLIMMTSLTAEIETQSVDYDDEFDSKCKV